MNEEKILSFKQPEAEVEPSFPPNGILRILQEVPDEIYTTYLQQTASFVDEILWSKNIVAARDKPHLFRHLTDELSESQLTRLSKIALSLAARDPCEKVGELMNAIFDFTPPTERSHSLAKTTLTHLKACGDYEKESLRLAVLARDLGALAELLAILSKSDDLTPAVLDRLSWMTENDLTRLITVINSSLTPSK